LPRSARGTWTDTPAGWPASFRFGPWRPVRVFCSAALAGELLETDFMISSGALIPMQVLDQVGDMNESFFIDHVDTEWILRAKWQGFRSFGVCDAIMEHSLGTETFHFWLGRWRTRRCTVRSGTTTFFATASRCSGCRTRPAAGIRNDIVRLLSWRSSSRCSRPTGCGGSADGARNPGWMLGVTDLCVERADRSRAQLPSRHAVGPSR